MRKPIERKLLLYFQHLDWPEEMVQLLLVHSISMTKADHAQLIRTVQAKCHSDLSPRTQERSASSARPEDGAVFEDCRAHEVATSFDPNMNILNSARELCSMNKANKCCACSACLDTGISPGSRDLRKEYCIISAN